MRRKLPYPQSLKLSPILLIFVATFLFTFSNNSFSQEKQNISYSKAQKQAVIEKIKNKTSLDLEERKIRIAILKEQYPVDWYEDMFGFKNGVVGACETAIHFTIKCNPYKIVEDLTPQQIKSLILNLDEHWVDYRMQEMVEIILAIVDELGKAEDNNKILNSDKEIIIISEFTPADKLDSDDKTLDKLSIKEIKTKYQGIYEAYYKDKYPYCGSYVKESFPEFQDKCLDFSLSEIQNLMKNKLILQNFRQKYYE